MSGALVPVVTVVLKLICFVILPLLLDASNKSKIVSIKFQVMISVTVTARIITLLTAWDINHAVTTGWGRSWAITRHVDLESAWKIGHPHGTMQQ